MAHDSKNLRPTVVKQSVFNTDEISRQADPEWVRDRNYMPAYKFTRRTFIDHRDHVYQIGDDAVITPPPTPEPSPSPSSPYPYLPILL